jgi:methyltransferase family protein
MNRVLRAMAAPVVRAAFPKWVRNRALRRYVQESVLPPPVATPDESPFVPVRLIGSGGIDLQASEQLSLLQRWESPRYQDLFATLRRDPTINTNVYGHGQAAVHNGLFPTPDAEAYAAMIVDRRPRRIVEVGSGYSTRVARAAVRYAKCETEIIVIDPSPRADVTTYADRIMLSPVEDSGVAREGWTGDDILFIDSSHVCRIRGDLPFLFCELLPALPAGTVVHVHDVFLPYDYPNVYDERCYNEEYLLFCTLSFTPRYRTLFASHWLSRQHGQAMRKTFGPAVGVDQLLYGASYWFDVKG